MVGILALVVAVGTFVGGLALWWVQGTLFLRWLP